MEYSSGMSNGDIAMFMAATMGRDDLTALLLSGSDPWSVRDGNGSNVIHVAAKSNAGSMGMVVAAGPPAGAIEAEDSDGYRPLHVCARYGNSKGAALLLSAGADPDARGARGRTPLHCAADSVSGRLDVILLLLLGAGADPMALDDVYETPLDAHRGAWTVDGDAVGALEAAVEAVLVAGVCRGSGGHGSGPSI